MGKERDKLLWSLGKKPNNLSNEEAYKEHMTRRIAEGNPPPRMKKILEEIAEENAKKIISCDVKK